MSTLLKLSQMRHSPRAFDGSALTWDDLADGFEAARLSSSSYNNQPWRFVVALRGEEAFDALLATAVEANRTWMADAGAIIAVLASTILEKTGETDHAALLGVGMAVAGLASMQAGGFDRKACKARLDLPEHILPVSLLAVGRLPVGHPIPAKQRKSMEAIAFRLGDPIL
jgi:nitroreductase